MNANRSQNKELEATEERKRKAKQLEMQRKESARAGRGMGGGMGNMPRTPVYPTYTPPTRPAVTDTYDSYEAEKNKSKFTAPKGKGMQLGKKSKNNDIFERVRGEMGHEVDDSPLITPAAASPVVAEAPAPRVSTTLDRDAIHITVNEAIAAKLSREGTVNSLTVSGDLNLRIADPSLTKLKLDLSAQPSHGAQFRTHPNVDRNLFNSSRVIQMSNTSRGFPVNQSVGVLRWRATPKVDDTSALPISFTVWVNKGSDGSYTLTVEYELTGGDALKDVSVTIPYATSEPTVSSFDATYDVSGDSVEWTIGTVDEDSPNGAFEFEAQADDENEFFPMQVRFSKTTPFVDVDVSLRSFACDNVSTDHGLGVLCCAGRNERGCDLLERDQVHRGQLYYRIICVLGGFRREFSGSNGYRLLKASQWTRSKTCFSFQERSSILRYRKTSSRSNDSARSCP